MANYVRFDLTSCFTTTLLLLLTIVLSQVYSAQSSENIKSEIDETKEEEPIVSGTLRYEIPYRAIGNKLREVGYKQSDDSRPSEMHRMSTDDVTNGSSVSTAQAPGNGCSVFCDSLATHREATAPWTYKHYRRPHESRSIRSGTTPDISPVANMNVNLRMIIVYICQVVLISNS